MNRNHDADGNAASSSTRGTRRRVGTVGVLGIALVAIAAVIGVRAARDEPPRVPADLPVDAWAPYWAIDAALADIGDRAHSLRELSPFWFRALGARTVERDPSAPERADDLIAVARRSGVRIVPAVVDAMPAGGMAGVLRDPTMRSAHVETLVDFVVDNGFDGVDIDYEQFAFADGRSTWEATRPAWVAFIAELGARLRELDKVLTVSIPPVYDTGRTDASGYWVYDHGAIAPHVDRIRVMAYDYSTSAPGPIAPLAWVQQAIDGTLAAVGDAEKIVLGIPLYGYNWPSGTSGDCAGLDVSGRTSVTIRSVGALAERRGGRPIFDETTGESAFVYDLPIDGGVGTCVQARRVHFVDAAGARLRIDLARRAGLGGVALWALGYDDDSVWDAIAEVAQAPRPANGPGERQEP
jgi:hypothetical protein